MNDDKYTAHSQRDADRSIRRIKEMIAQGISQAEIVETLNSEGYRTIRLRPWNVNNLRQVLFKIRHELKSWYGLSGTRCGLSSIQV